MRRLFMKTLAASLVTTATLGFSSMAFAQDAATFYADKTIKWIIPYKPGGGYDEYSRGIIPYFEKYTGSKVELENVPGAGGMKGANEIFNAPADGLTVGIINGSAMVTAELSGIEGASFKVADYSYLGRMVADLRVLVVGTNSPFKTYEDLQNSSRDVVVGATGLGGSTYVDAVLTGPALGIEQKVVHGFDNSGDVRQAMLRGDVDAMWGSLGSAIQGVQDGEHVIVVQSDRKRSMLVPDVPSIFDFVDAAVNTAAIMPMMEAWDALNAVGRPVAGPPGIPEDRLTFLQSSFEKAMSDPEFVDMMTKSERELSYLNGADTKKVAKSSTQMTDDVKGKVVAAIKGEI